MAGAFKTCPPDQRIAGRQRLEEFAQSLEGEDRAKGLLYLKIAYGDRAAFDEFVSSIDPAVDLNKGEGGNPNKKTAFNDLMAICRVAKFSWLNSDAFVEKVNAMFKHENHFSVERLINIVGQNDLVQFLPNAIAHFESQRAARPTDNMQRVINNIKKCTGSRTAFDFVKSVQKDYRIDHMKAFAWSVDPAIRKEAREYSKLPPLSDDINVLRRETLAKQTRRVSHDLTLDPSLLGLLVEAGWPESTKLDDLQVYDLNTTTAGAYGAPIAMTLLASGIGSSGRFIKGDDFEFWYVLEQLEVEVENKKKKQRLDVISYIVNDTLYQYETKPWFGIIMKEVDRQELINKLFAKHGIAQRVAFLSNPKYKKDSFLNTVLCAAPAKLVKLEEDLTLKYIKGQ